MTTMLKAQTIMNNEANLTQLIQICNARIDKLFSSYLPTIPALALKNALTYTLKNSGKRLRPLLVYASGLTFNAPWENMDVAAGAIELIHTYSLIHDDLPCMDNADLRRSKPTCHKVYGDGMAVLTGDALQTLAMQIIAEHPAPLTAQNRLQMLAVLSQASGPYGMAAGQALDIAMMNVDTIAIDLLEKIHYLKTGTLLSACLELGRLSSNDHDETNQQALKKFGDSIGLAFQIQDDILDMEMSTETLGKSQGIDAKNHKNTYPIIVGLSAAKDKVQTLYATALESINYLGHRAQLLQELAQMMLQRKK